MSTETWDNIEFVYNHGDLNKYAGFVYRIICDDNKIYYGIKKFWKVVKYPPLKGRKNKRHIKKESDWKTYKTSSPIMQEELKNNKQRYYCEVVRLCESVTEMKAYEAWYQLNHYVSGDWDNLINQVINLRLRIR